ncbi:hypothetical protein ACIRPH_18605 [Nocardiopsis sp. NPDC101807]|uniref:hypothetical protein n=1 Tax=Nocardiopsis sp. NPDC101807 TaxID=3364339 RepID=UPI0037F33A1B
MTPHTTGTRGSGWPVRPTPTALAIGTDDLVLAGLLPGTARDPGTGVGAAARARP